ncbi:amidophosphoribosyltransferase [Helicobacter sp. 23-1044]
MKKTNFESLLAHDSRKSCESNESNANSHESFVDSHESFEFRESPNEKCAVVGVFNANRSAVLCYYALFAMQHRGQESSGISTTDGHKITTIKGEGLVTSIFKGGLDALKGSASIGHNRYSTAGEDSKCDVQPIFAKYALGEIALAHNGNLVNAKEVRDDLTAKGAIFQSHLDTENLIHLIAHSKKERLRDRIIESLQHIKGAYSFVILSRGKLFAIRDPYGFRPLSLGEITNEDGTKGYIVASETCAFDLIGARFVRDINPGEMVIFSSSDSSCGNSSLDKHSADLLNFGRSQTASLVSRPKFSKNNESHTENPSVVLNAKCADSPKQSKKNNPQDEFATTIESIQVFPPTPKHCIFEFVYFARPDSFVFGKSVYEIRKNMGVELAREHKISADFVIPVPDSGVISAIGYSQESKIPFEFGIVRNHYIGRTFIEPTQSMRELKVKLKLNPIEKLIEGKDIIIIDDSIVRGTTSKQIISILRKAGAKKIHLIIASPETIAPCYYGVDTPDSSQLISANKSADEVCAFIGADSLHFLSLNGLYKSIGVSDGSGYCKACFDKEYII